MADLDETMEDGTPFNSIFIGQGIMLTKMLRHLSPEIEAMRLEKERNKRSVRRLL